MARRGSFAAIIVLLGLLPAMTVRAETVLDDFEQLSGWTTLASEGARVWLVPEPGHTGMGMRVGFDLASGGFIIVRKTFTVPLPENYAFTFWLRGEGRRNNFEFKVVDGSGKNVWWRNQREFVFPGDWQQMTIRKSRLAFAWGRSSKELRQVSAIEFAISAGEGGAGAFWLDDLHFEEREPVAPDGKVPEVHASSALPGHEPALVLDDDAGTSWLSEPVPRSQWLLVDFLRNREYGGLAIDWDAQDYPVAFDVQVSNDGVGWTTSYSTETGHGGRDYIYLPDAESRFIRLDLKRSSRAQGYGITHLVVKPFEFSASPNDFFTAIARDAPPGTYPKYVYNRQTYWTVVGVDGDEKEALLNEEGMLEVDRGAFSIEPFLYAGGSLITWQGVTTSQELEDGYLPIPSVTWHHDRLTLTVTTFAGGEPGNSTLYARYRVSNLTDHGEPVRLYLAIRPFQVNPPWQTLNTSGGVTHVRDIRFDGRVVWVDKERAVVPLGAPDGFGAATFEEGSVTDFLLNDRLPVRTEVSDPLAFASAALRYNLYLESKGRAEVALAIPFQAASAAVPRLLGAGGRPAFIAEQEERVRHEWEERLARVEISVPPEGGDLVRSIKSTIAYTLINRDGPAIRPGSRNYARSWIRDGAMTSTALLEMGFTQEVRDFLRWYAGYQGSDGKIPCCIDRRGPDPVSEHDSAGEFIYGIMEYYRYTHDIGFVHEMWPRVIRAVDYMVGLRERRLTDEYKAPDKRAFYGLLPESISHEGYSSHPVHSYWDDFFALRGFKDAAEMAVIVGDDARAARLEALRDNFRETLLVSLARAMAAHDIDYLPGSVELADFDPTSTAAAIVPGGELGHLPGAAVQRTFERYYADFEAWRRGEGDREGYSPYELRNAGVFVRLGEKQKALELLQFFLADQRPHGWNAWGEIAWRDPQAPRFIGDMPHTWVGSGFITSARSLFAYERESDRALVVGAGLPAAWVMSERGVEVKRLPTHYGILNFTMRGESADAVRVRISGDLAVPPGGIVVRSPLAKPVRSARVNGSPDASATAEGIVVRAFPAQILLEY